MKKHITVIQGHPDSKKTHFGHALASAYIKGARSNGHDVRLIEVADLNFPLIRSAEEYERCEPPESIKLAQATINWADHLVLFFPLWMGNMPASFKAFLEQIFRNGFAFEVSDNKFPKKLLKGKSAHVVVTMGMPAFIYRWYFGAHSVKALIRNILSFCGIKPITTSLIGMVDSKNPDGRKKWLAKLGKGDI